MKLQKKTRFVKPSIVVIILSGMFLIGCNNNSSENQPEKKTLNLPASQPSSTAKVPFNQLFQVNADGSVSPKVVVSIKGVTMTSGVKFTSGVTFSGVDITKYIGHDIEVNQQNGVCDIVRFY